MDIYIDGDACPVKDEVYRVAKRYGLKVFVVTNSSIYVPKDPMIELIVVKGGFDAADNQIVEMIQPDDIAITSDIPLADRCLTKGARVLGPKGDPFTEHSIGDALATRALMDHLRQAGVIGGGPPPFSRQDRSRFLSALDDTIHAIRKRRR